MFLICDAQDDKSLSLGAHIHVFLMKLIGKHEEVKVIRKLNDDSTSSSSEEDRIEYRDPIPLIRAETTRQLKCLKVANLIHCN